MKDDQFYTELNLLQELAQEFETPSQTLNNEEEQNPIDLFTRPERHHMALKLLNGEIELAPSQSHGTEDEAPSKLIQ